MEIEVVLGKNKKVDAHFKGFIIHTDQPEKSGGDGEYPSPLDIFLSSLATCAGFYAKSFCQQRDISEEGIKIIQKMNRNPETKLYSNIDVEIILPEGFPEKYHKPLIKAVEACSVKKHIEQAPEFSVSIKDTANE